MLYTDFSEYQSLSLPVDASIVSDWNYLLGSGDDLQFAEGITQPVVMHPNGVHLTMIANARQPAQMHQSVEVKVSLGDSVGSVALTGAFCRAVDSDNMLVIYVDHNTLIAYIYERLAGLMYLRADTTSFPAAASAHGASCRMEVIGKRVRWWFERAAMPVLDRPPDGAFDLTDAAVAALTVTGDWGIYSSSNFANSMEFRSFSARDLPSAVAAPPDLTVFDASGRDYVPVTLTMSDTVGGTIWYEWTIWSDDPDDYAEAYIDLCTPDINSRVFYVRPGYSYEARVRSLTNKGEFHSPQRVKFTASGSKTAPTSPDMPDDEWPDVTPDYVLRRTQSANNTAMLADGGYERVVSDWIRPRNAWSLQFAYKTKGDIQLIMDFFDHQAGKERPFKWTHPTTGENFSVRFDIDELSATVQDMGTDTPWFSIEVPIIESPINNVETLEVTLTIDSSLTEMDSRRRG